MIFSNKAMLLTTLLCVGSTIFSGAVCSRGAAAITPDTPVSAVIRYSGPTLSPRNRIFHIFLNELLEIRLNHAAMMAFLTDYQSKVAALLARNPGDDKYSLLQSIIEVSIIHLNSTTTATNQSIAVAREIFKKLIDWLNTDERTHAITDSRRSE